MRPQARYPLESVSDTITNIIRAVFCRVQSIRRSVYITVNDFRESVEGMKTVPP